MDSPDDARPIHKARKVDVGRGDGAVGVGDVVYDKGLANVVAVICEVFTFVCGGGRRPWGSEIPRAGRRSRGMQETRP